MWRNSTSFGIKDPQFGKDVSFYVFEYPWLRFVTSFSFAMIVITVLAVVFVNYVYGGIRISGRGPKLTRAAQVHLSVLVGLGVLLRAVSYYLDRFGLAIGPAKLFDGITYTDVNARIPSKNILIWVAILCAILFFASIFIRSWALPAIGLGLLGVTSILLGAIWPAVMQGFQVKPSEPDKEGPYIARNIEATRQAYDVADIKVESYSANRPDAGRAGIVSGVARQHASARPDTDLGRIRAAAAGARLLRRAADARRRPLQAGR